MIEDRIFNCDLDYGLQPLSGEEVVKIRNNPDNADWWDISNNFFLFGRFHNRISR